MKTFPSDFTLLYITVVLVTYSNDFIDSTRADTVSIPLRWSTATGGSELQSLITTSLEDESASVANESHNCSIDGRPGEGYYITVKLGTPPQTINVLIDTGSSNFAVASLPDPLIDSYFVTNNSSSFVHKNISINVPYTMGSWHGYLASDLIQMQGLSPIRSDIACITQSDHFFINGSRWQGILGLAYGEIARPPNKTMPLFDTLVKQSMISNVLSLQLCGKQKDQGKRAGTLVLGGVDFQLYVDQIRYTPLKREWYFEVILTGLTVGQESLDIDCKELNNDKSIVDSGTTNFRLPPMIFEKLISKLKNWIHLEKKIPEEFWSGKRYICVDTIFGFPDLRLSLIHSRNSTFTLVISPRQYFRVVPDSENRHKANATCYKFAITSSESGTVIGAVIMEGLYVVFDRQNRRIGFAKAACDVQDSHEFGPEIEGPFSHPDPYSCVYKPHVNKTLEIVSYILLSLAVVCVLPLFIMLGQWVVQRWRHRKLSRLIETSSVSGD